MRDSEVVGGEIGGLGISVGEGRVGVVQELGIAVVFHHDHPNVIQMRNSFGYRSLLRIRCGCESGGQQARQYSLHVHHQSLRPFQTLQSPGVSKRYADSRTSNDREAWLQNGYRGIKVW